MIVYVYPADMFGCGHYRLAWPAVALRAQGHDVRVIMPNSRQGIGGDIDTRTDTLLEVRVPPDADVVVMQRVSMSHLARAIPMMRSKGIAVVVDMDDDLTRIDPSNPAFTALSTKSGNARHNWRNAHQACLDATLVTVSTPALLKVYAPHGRGVIIENRIPAAYLGIPHDDAETFGWPGSIHSHPNDPQVLGPAVARLAREGYDYYGVGPDYRFTPGDGGLRRAFGLDFDPPVSGNVDFDQWPIALSKLGVGLAPLADTAFNAAKSWLKPLELMAVGVPWVASPRAEYVRLHALTGAGLLARKPTDWYKLTRSLLNSASLRREMSEHGRAAAASWTIEGNAWRWAEAWESALLAQRGATTSAV